MAVGVDTPSIPSMKLVEMLLDPFPPPLPPIVLFCVGGSGPIPTVESAAAVPIAAFSAGPGMVDTGPGIESLSGPGPDWVPRARSPRTANSSFALKVFGRTGGSRGPGGFAFGFEV